MDDASQLLAYKVVEVATVDEASLEQTVNTWVRRGWRLENVQFAMRESSRRPSMAFVFFTRPESPPARAAPNLEDVSAHDQGAFDAAPDDDSEREVALARLRRIAEQGATVTRASDAPGAAAGPAISAWERLRQLAGEDDGEAG